MDMDCWEVLLTTSFIIIFFITKRGEKRKWPKLWDKIGTKINWDIREKYIIKILQIICTCEKIYN